MYTVACSAPLYFSGIAYFTSIQNLYFGKGVQVQIVPNCLTTAFLFLLGDILHIKMSCVMMCTDLVITVVMVVFESLCINLVSKVLRTLYSDFSDGDTIQADKLGVVL